MTEHSYHFLSANQEKVVGKFFSWTQYELCFNWYDWRILAANEKRINWSGLLELDCLPAWSQTMSSGTIGTTFELHPVCKEGLVVMLAKKRSTCVAPEVKNYIWALQHPLLFENWPILQRILDPLLFQSSNVLDLICDSRYLLHLFVHYLRQVLWTG